MLLNVVLYRDLFVQYPIDWEQWQADIQRYVDLIKEWNQRLSLVSPKDVEVDCIPHIEDSLSLLPYILEGLLVPERKIWVDIGSGGGFPAIPILLTRRDISTLLIERKSKKVGFLQMLISKFKLVNTRVVCDNFPPCLQRSTIRKEDIGVITSRGVEKPESIASFLSGWMDRGMKYLCQSPQVDMYFPDDIFNKEVVKDIFTEKGMRRGRLVIIEKR